MYSGKRVRGIFVIYLVIESMVCNMNEPRCYSRFDYEEKMLEKMVKTEVKMEKLLGKLEALEKRQTNVEIELDTSIEDIHALEKRLTNAETEVDISVNDNHVLEKRLTSVENELDNSSKEIHSLEKKHDQRLTAMSRNITESMRLSPVAFFATLSSSFTTSTSSQTIVFNNVVTDVGGGYNPKAGVFTATVDGLYVFSASVMVDLSTSTTTAFNRINKNGGIVVHLYVNDSDGNYETVSGTVILSLQVGDTVNVSCDSSKRSIAGVYYTFFSGFRL